MSKALLYDATLCIGCKACEQGCATQNHLSYTPTLAAQEATSAYKYTAIVTHGDDQIIEQIIKQLHKLVNVIKVTDLQEGEYLHRELILAKVNATEQTKPEILRLVEIFRGKIVDVSPKTYTIEITGGEEKIRALLELLRPLGVKEFVRTGQVAMPRGLQSVTV